MSATNQLTMQDVHAALLQLNDALPDMGWGITVFNQFCTGILYQYGTFREGTNLQQGLVAIKSQTFKQPFDALVWCCNSLYEHKQQLDVAQKLFTEKDVGNDA